MVGEVNVWHLRIQRGFRSGPPGARKRITRHMGRICVPKAVSKVRGDKRSMPHQDTDSCRNCSHNFGRSTAWEKAKVIPPIFHAMIAAGLVERPSFRFFIFFSIP